MIEKKLKNRKDALERKKQCDLNHNLTKDLEVNIKYNTNKSQ